MCTSRSLRRGTGIFSRFLLFPSRIDLMKIGQETKKNLNVALCVRHYEDRIFCDTSFEYSLLRLILAEKNLAPTQSHFMPAQTEHCT